MMNLTQFVSILCSDPPFSYPHPDERTKALLVETSSINLFKQELGIRYRNFMHNSGITAIIGRARSGKTHFIYNFEHVTNVEKRYKGLVVVLSLVGEEITLDYLVESIVNSSPFQDKTYEVGIDSNRHKNAELINLLIKELRAKYGADVGILFAIDNIDEHFRQRATKVTDPKEDSQKFLGSFRLLIEKVDKGLCVVFSLTEDAANKFENYLSDPTLRERFDLIYNPNDPGNRLELSELSENEVILMVSRYMYHWAHRNGINLPDVKECSVEGENIFPFTPDALKLFRNAGSFAGHICLGCRNVLSRKCGAQTAEELVVSEKDAAFTISASASMFPNFPTLKSYISNLIGSSAIESETEKWIDTVAKTKFSGNILKSDFKTAFGNYLETIAKESQEKIDFEYDVAVIDPYTHKPLKLDMRLSRDDMQIGIIFTPNPVVDLKIGKALVVALKNRNITHGMFIYAGKKPELDFKAERKQGLSFELIEELRDRVSGTDFNSVVLLQLIDEFNAWGIIRAREIIDPGMKIRVLSWVESRLQLIKKLDELISAEPRNISSQRLRAGDLLGRGGA